MTIGEILIIYSCFQYFDISNWLFNGLFLLKFILLFCFVIAPVFPQCDARSRFQNYKQVKDHLYLYGFQPRIIKPFSFSRCQRDAVIAAAEELGLEKECKQYFKKQGHYWYHLLPEFLYHRPTYLFYKSFWLNTFFAKYYRPKINFSVIAREAKMIDTNNYCFHAGSAI
jgi:hypothetical protein